MSTNDNKAVDETNDAPITDEDLRNLKYPEDGVEPPKEEDEPTDGDEEDESEEEDGSEEIENDESESDGEEERSDEPTEFVKEFPNIKGDTPEEYARNLEIAYNHSTAEVMRIKKAADEAKQTPPPVGDDEEPDDQPAKKADPASAWVNSQIDREIEKAWNEFKGDYPQVNDEDQYERFKGTVARFSRVALEEGRMEDPAKLYSDAALSLGWQKQSVPTDKEKLGMAMKQNAASSKAPASSAKPPVKSKVTDAQIQAHRHLTNTTKSDAEIRKELESFVN